MASTRSLNSTERISDWWLVPWLVISQLNEAIERLVLKYERLVKIESFSSISLAGAENLLAAFPPNKWSSRRLVRRLRNIENLETTIEIGATFFNLEKWCFRRNRKRNCCRQRDVSCVCTDYELAIQGLRNNKSVQCVNAANDADDEHEKTKHTTNSNCLYDNSGAIYMHICHDALCARNDTTCDAK